MQTTIVCPHCNHEIELNEAFTHRIEEQLVSSLQDKHKKALEDARKSASEEASRKIKDQVARDLEALKTEKDEERERNKKLVAQMDKLLEELRDLKRKDEDRELEMKKKLLEEEAKIRNEAVKRTEEEHRLKDLEKDKKLSDTLKQVEELKAKMQQGSQQTQGEVLELELERAIRSEFPTDTVTEIKKGDRGADILHTIIDKLGRTCGSLLWESKNAQWNNDWIAKLKEDQRSKKSDIAILVTIHTPPGLETFTYRDGVWITAWKYALPLAFALRYNLISLHHEKVSSVGKNEKMEVLYHYLTGVEFHGRIEAIVEAFTNLQDELEREKRWFSTKWNRQEKEIRKVLDHTHGMYGDLQGIIGRSLPGMKGLELTPGDNES